MIERDDDDAPHRLSFNEKPPGGKREQWIPIAYSALIEGSLSIAPSGIPHDRGIRRAQIDWATVAKETGNAL